MSDEDKENENNAGVKRICSSCGTRFDSEFDFCPNCGKKFGEEKKSEMGNTETSQKSDSEGNGSSFNRFCPNCGSPVERNISFCPKCGAKQELVQKKRYGLWILLIILLVLGGLSFVFVPKILEGDIFDNKNQVEVVHTKENQNSSDSQSGQQEASEKTLELSEEDKEALELGRQVQKANEEYQKMLAEEDARYNAELEAERQRLLELEWRPPETFWHNYISMPSRAAKYIEIDTTDVKRIKIEANCAQAGTQLKFDLLASLDDFNDFSNVSTDGGYSHYAGFNYLGKSYMREFKCNEWKHGQKIYLAMKNRNWAFDAAVSVKVTCYYNDNYN